MADVEVTPEDHNEALRALLADHAIANLQLQVQMRALGRKVEELQAELDRHPQAPRSD